MSTTTLPQEMYLQHQQWPGVWKDHKATNDHIAADLSTSLIKKRKRRKRKKKNNFVCMDDPDTDIIPPLVYRKFIDDSDGDSSSD